jgi:protein-S-isoprenylcysteine O-methyltransferase Ste14
MFTLIFLTLWLSFVGIRLRFRRIWVAIPRQGWHASRERALTGAAALTQLVPGILWMGGGLSSGSIGLPDAMRWVGVALGVGALALLYRVHATLGANFSPRLELREAHTLIDTGPYRRVRHPMYTSGFMLCLALGFVSANLWVGALPFVALAVLVALRLPDEEAMLAARFGAPFEAYRRRSGALTPWW